MTAGEVTPDAFNRVVLIAWVASLFVAVSMTIVAFLLHRLLMRPTRLRVLSGVLAVANVAFIYFSAGMSLMAFVNMQLRPASRERGSDFSMISIHYHPGIVIKVSLLGAVIVTWLVLTAWKSRTANPPNAVV
jgi:hypothetical protein